MTDISFKKKSQHQSSIIPAASVSLIVDPFCDISAQGESPDTAVSKWHPGPQELRNYNMFMGIVFRKYCILV